MKILKAVLVLSVLALVVFANSVLDKQLGKIVAETFEEGTSCAVSIGESDFQFFPVRGVLKDVSIVHPAEKDTGGFYADSVSIRVEVTSLFRKLLELTDLEIKGARVVSKGVDSGFYQTLDFVIPSPAELEEFRASDPPSWHRWLTGNWSVHLNNVVVETEKENGPHLTLLTDDVAFMWSGIHFVAEEWQNIRELPHDLLGQSEDFSVAIDDLDPLHFGPMDAKVQIKNQVMTILKAEVGSGNSLSSAVGKVHLADEGRYEIETSSKIHEDYLSSVIKPFYTLPDNRQFAASIRGKLGGALLSPEFDADAEVSFSKGGLLAFQSGCALKELMFHATVSAEQLRITDVRSKSDLFLAELIEIDFTDNHRFSGEATIKTTRDSSFFRSCEEDTTASESAPDSLFLALKESFATSSSNVSFSGTLEPLLLEGSLSSELHKKTRSEHSKLNADWKLEGDIVTLELREEAVHERVALESSSFTGDSEQTAFERVDHGVLKADIEYSLALNDLSVKSLKLEQYQLRKLLAFVSLFSAPELIEPVLRYSDRDTLISANYMANLSFEPFAAEGRGTVVFSDLGLDGFTDSEVSITSAFKGLRVELPRIVFNSRQGTVEAKGSVSTDGSIAFNGSVDDLRFSDLEAIEVALPGLVGTVSGKFSAGGTLGQPTYLGEFSLKTFADSNPERVFDSELDIKGNRRHALVGGSLHSGSSTFSLRYPFSGDETLQLDAAFNEMPIDSLVWFYDRLERQEADVVDEAKKPSGGAVTAELHYQGPKDTLLRGEGSILVASLQFDGDGFQISNPAPLAISISDGRMKFDDVVLESDGRELSIKGYIDSSTGWNVGITGSWSLRTLIPPGDIFEQLGGRLRINLNAKGPVDALSLSGDIKLRRGSVSLFAGDSIVGASGISATAVFDGDRVIISDVSASIEGGRLGGSGRVLNLLSPQKRDVDIGLQFDQFVIEPTPELVAQLSGEVRYVHSPTVPPNIRGVVLVDNATYEATVDLKDIIRKIGTVVVGSQTAPQRSGSVARRASFLDEEIVTLDILVSAGNSIVVETNILQSVFRGDLRIDGAVSAPNLSGEVVATEGAFGFKASRFEIVKAVVRFSKNQLKIDPELDIVGERTIVGQYGDEELIRLIISGRASNPKLRFTSSAGRSEREIIAALGAGTSITDVRLLGLSGETKNLSDIINPVSGLSVKERLVGLTAFSEIGIDGSVSIETGEVVPKVSAKRPITAKSTLELSSELAGENVSGATVRYPLTSRLDALAGWRSISSSVNRNDSSGAFEFGFDYELDFPGVSLIPPTESDYRLGVVDAEN